MLDKISKIRSMFILEIDVSFLLNFNESNGILITKRQGIMIASIVISWMSANIGNLSKSICGIAAIKIANAGVGRPINE